MKRSFLLGVLAAGLFFSLSGQMNEKRTLEETSHRIYSVAYDPAGEFIATTGSDHNIIVWNVERGIIHRTLAGLKKRPNQAVFGKGGEVLWSVGEDGALTHWDIFLGQVKSSTEAHSGAIKTLAINSDGSMLISGGADKMVRVWNIRDEKPELIYELKGHRKTITSADFSPDGQHAVTGAGDKMLMLWDVQAGVKLQDKEAHDGWIRGVCFSPDGRHISSGGDDGLIRTWDAGNLSPVRTLEGHEGWVQSLTYTPSGKYLISGGHDKTIRIWDAETGSQLSVSDKLEQIVLSVEASPVSGEFITACLLSEKLRIWTQAFDRDFIVRADKPTTKVEVSDPLPDPESPTVAIDLPVATVLPVGTELPENLPPQIIIFSPMLEDGQVVCDKSSIFVVGKAEGEEGIQSVVINGELAKLNEAGVFQAEVDLVHGENQVEVVAVSYSGKMGNSQLLVQCTDESAGASIEETAGPGLAGGKYYALIIGINDYADEDIVDLDYPIADAESFYQILLNNYNYKSENITFLKNPTRTELYLSFEELGHKVSPADNLLIFYAGHGFWDEKSDIGYWLPHDAASSNSANWFRNSTLRDFIGSIDTRHTLLIADACFSGSIFKTRAGFSKVEQGIMKLHRLPSRKAMTSGAKKEEVPDQSVFVKYLIKELEQNKEPYLSSESLFGNFKTAVLNNSPNIPQYGTIQNAGDEGGDFVFIRKN